MTQTHYSAVFLCILACCALPLAQGSRLLLQSASNSTFECGKPMGPCGKAIPAGVKCDKGPGFCQPGYFCGWEDNTGQASKCLPVPAKCGTAGNPCCPSNTKEPHTSNDDKLKREPYCSDGSTCFFFKPLPGVDNGDIYAGNTGTLNCMAIPKNCGTGPGTPCCPMPYHTDSNPPLSMKQYGCGLGTNMFCNYITVPGRQSTGLPSGTCEYNPSDCGQFGKKCCISTGGSATGMRCGGEWGSTGVGYCANPADYKGSSQAPLKDLICTPCPASLDPSLETTNPDLYLSCKKL